MELARLLGHSPHLIPPHLTYDDYDTDDDGGDDDDDGGDDDGGRSPQVCT